jgi:hypothetical protein
LFLFQSKEKSLGTNGRKRFSNLAQRQSTSLISLSDTKSANLTDDLNLTCDKHVLTPATPVTDVKLEPIIQAKRDECQVQVAKQYRGILKCPSENVRARLSADSRKDVDDEPPSMDKMSLSGSDTSNEKELKSRPTSSQKLEKIEMNLQNTIRKIEDNKNLDDFNKRLGDYCLKAIDSVKNYNEVIETHKENLEHVKEDTDKIVETFKDAESMELKLKRTHLMSFDPNDLTEDNLDFVSQILKEEAEFQAKYQESNKNGNVKKKEPTVGPNDKKKLLATLRAIDNGDSIDSFESGSQKKSQLMKELFGDIAD